MKSVWTFIAALFFCILMQGAEPGMNFVYNGGFEKETNPGLADGWGPFYWGWGMGGETGFYKDLGSLMHPDKEEAFEGKKSMRLLLPNGLRMLSLQHPFISAMVPGKEAVFSAYLKTIKGRRAKVRLQIRFLHAPNSPAKTFTVDDQWRRYEVKFTVPKKGGLQPWIQFIEGYAVWIDAVKVEHGGQATAFVPFAEKSKKGTKTAGSAKVPRYQIPVLDKAPVLTGTMSDPLWQRALEIKDFYQVKSGTPVTKNQTKVRMFIHGTTLYAAAECLGPNSEPLIRKRDGMVWTDDCFEIFLDPGNPVVHDDQKMYGSYYHLVFNSAGAVYDIYTGGETRPFNGRIRAKASRTENMWICEIAVDLASLNVNPVKSHWRLLLGREDHTSNQVSANVPLPEKFHDYGRFAEAEVPPRPVDKLNSIQVRTPELESRGLILRIRSREKFSADYELTVTRNRRKLLERSGRITVEKTEQMHRFPLASAENGPTTVELVVQGDSGERLVKNWKISGDSGSYFRRSYYTSEKQAELIWNGELPEEKSADFSGKKVPWRKAEGKLLFDLSGVPDGDYPVRIGGKEIQFAKYPPKANEVKIDRLNNILLVDGKPFIFYGPFVSYSFLQRFVLETWLVKDLKKRGFNGLTLRCYEGYEPGSWGEKNRCLDPEWFKKVLDVCAKHGLKVIVYCFIEHIRGPKFVSVNNPRTLIPRFKDHPAVLAWYFFDEPVAAHYKQIWDSYNFAKKEDPYHPFLVNVTDHGLASEVVRDKKTGRDPFDIYSLTFYPISRRTAPDARLKDTPGLFVKMRNAVRKEHGVLYHAAQSIGYGSDHWYRTPTPTEISFLVYMPLLYGNTGWQWFGGPDKCPETQSAIESYVPEMNFMAELIGNGEALHRGEVFTSLCGNVLGTLRKYNGKYYLLTVSKSERAVKTRFNLSARLPGSPTKAEVLFEKRSHDLLTDDHYGPFQRHVYVFEVK